MKTPKKKKPYNLLVYVEKCETKLKKFKTTKEMGKFIDEYLKLHPEYTSEYSDYWIDYAIENISGKITFFTDGLKVN